MQTIYFGGLEGDSEKAYVSRFYWLNKEWINNTYNQLHILEAWRGVKKKSVS